MRITNLDQQLETLQTNETASIPLQTAMQNSGHQDVNDSASTVPNNAPLNPTPNPSSANVLRLRNQFEQQRRSVTNEVANGLDPHVGSEATTLHGAPPSDAAEDLLASEPHAEQLSDPIVSNAIQHPVVMSANDVLHLAPRNDNSEQSIGAFFEGPAFDAFMALDANAFNEGRDTLIPLLFPIPSTASARHAIKARPNIINSMVDGFRKVLTHHGMVFQNTGTPRLVPQNDHDQPTPLTNGFSVDELEHITQSLFAFGLSRPGLAVAQHIHMPYESAPRSSEITSHPASNNNLSHTDVATVNTNANRVILQSGISGDNLIVRTPSQQQMLDISLARAEQAYWAISEYIGSDTYNEVELRHTVSNGAQWGPSYEHESNLHQSTYEEIINEHAEQALLKGGLLRTWLSDNQIDVAPNSSGGPGAENCLIISLLQHATGDYANQHAEAASDLRDWLIEQEVGVSLGQRLYSDDTAFEKLVSEINRRHDVNLNITFIQADSYGRPVAHSPLQANSANARNVVVFDSSSHFEAVVARDQRQQDMNVDIRDASPVATISDVEHPNVQGPGDDYAAFGFASQDDYQAALDAQREYDQRPFGALSREEYQRAVDQQLAYEMQMQSINSSQNELPSTQVSVPPRTHNVGFDFGTHDISSLASQSRYNASRHERNNHGTQQHSTRLHQGTRLPPQWAQNLRETGPHQQRTNGTQRTRTHQEQIEEARELQRQYDRQNSNASRTQGPQRAAQQRMRHTPSEIDIQAARELQRLYDLQNDNS